jgi:hypothetical protein
VFPDCAFASDAASSPEDATIPGTRRALQECAPFEVSHHNVPKSLVLRRSSRFAHNQARARDPVIAIIDPQ